MGWCLQMGVLSVWGAGPGRSPVKKEQLTLASAWELVWEEQLGAGPVCVVWNLGRTRWNTVLLHQGDLRGDMSLHSCRHRGPLRPMGRVWLLFPKDLASREWENGVDLVSAVCRGCGCLSKELKRYKTV